MRLFCFHHAGGAGAMFNGWNKALGPSIDVMPVEVLNRERFSTLRHLVDEVDEQLRPALEGPHAFFGHSFGALLAYRLACSRAESGSALPRALMVSSFAPPHLPPPIPAVDHLDDHQLTTMLCALGGIPPELTDWPALRDKAVTAARTDLRLCMTDSESAPVALPCPIYAFGGDDDPLVTESDLTEWQTRTASEFAVHVLQGGHFYLSDGPPLHALLTRLLSKLPAASQKC